MACATARSAGLPRPAGAGDQDQPVVPVPGTLDPGQDRGNGVVSHVPFGMAIGA